MKELLKPQALKAGDTVATVSLSWGGAGDPEILWRYKQGVKRLEEVFGLKVIEMPHTLKGSDYIYNHPEKRASDLMEAFKNPDIKGIIATIGGIESIRMLPFIDFDVLRNNPKVFMGYSDTTTTHMMCFKAGLSSIYGPSLLVDFAENIEMDAYTIDHINKALFSTQPIGEIRATSMWTSEHLPWLIENKDTKRHYQPTLGHQLIQGKGRVQGRLIGGCLEVINHLRGTSIFPSKQDFTDSILFLETSEDKPPSWLIECELRHYGITGILDGINGIICGKPQDEYNMEAYNKAILQVLKEFGREDMPVMTNMHFGHTEPKICLPYGALAEIDCDKKTFKILESGCR